MDWCRLVWPELKRTVFVSREREGEREREALVSPELKRAVFASRQRAGERERERERESEREALVSPELKGAIFAAGGHSCAICAPVHRKHLVCVPGEILDELAEGFAERMYRLYKQDTYSQRYKQA